jgi:type IV fimbrial biogenesis protein FimT
VVCRDIEFSAPAGLRTGEIACRVARFRHFARERSHSSFGPAELVSFAQGGAASIGPVITEITMDGTSSLPAEGGEMNCGRAAGFTLLELLITISIAAILLTIGIPSFRYITNANRISGEVNGLLGDLQFARAEAVKEGRTVTVCVGNASGCTGTTAWQNGWIVFSDPTDVGVLDLPNETVLRIQSPFSSTDTFDASNGVSAITFNREGYAVGIANGTLIELHDSTDTSVWTRCLSVNLSGETATEIYDGVNCT